MENWAKKLEYHKNQEHSTELCQRMMIVENLRQMTEKQILDFLKPTTGFLVKIKPF